MTIVPSETVNSREFDEHRRALEAAQRRIDSALDGSVTSREFDEHRRALESALKRIDRALEHVEQLKANELLQRERTDGLRREMTLLHSASEEAIHKSESATEKRFDGVNQFRDSLADAQLRFMPREVADSQIEEIRKALQVLTGRVDTAAGKSLGASATIGLIIGAITIISAIILAANGVI